MNNLNIVNKLLKANVCSLSKFNMTKKINYDTKHLKKGDPLPKYTGNLRLYNMRYCPFAQRTVLALIAKNIDFEVVNINLMDKPEWLTQKNPYGKVPAIEISEDVVIYESLITVDYLDEMYPQRPLLPKDPLKKALDKIVVENAMPIHVILMKLLRSPDQITQDVINEFHRAFGFLQTQLVKRGTKYIGGDQPGYVDYMVWPWIERWILLKKDNKILQVDEDKFCLLIKYFENMLDDPVVKEYSIPDDIMTKFFKFYLDGKVPEYDMMCKE